MPADPGPIEALSAVTLVTADMAASVAFYEAVGFECAYGGADAAFTSFRVGPTAFLNLQLVAGWRSPAQVWGRTIVWVDDVDAAYHRVVAAGYEPAMAPSDAPWGERYFHVPDPAGHELSVARPLDPQRT
ncbi:MAG: VOC family protein [Acidimicrobiales bacterium]|jgi:predicted enzyme related to lactoylglutathione lyase|nr:VOC family protein [Acidimicrobiales bacterium]